MTVEPVAFSPRLHVDDALAGYWIRQVMLRLRREIFWCWHQRGLMSPQPPAGLPPAGDRVSEALDASRFWEEKVAFFQADPTAAYLTGRMQEEPPAGDGRSGSFSTVAATSGLDDAAKFALALALADYCDSAVGPVIAACHNDPARTRPTLALVQKLWDDADGAAKLCDPAHPLFRNGLLRVASGQPGPVIDWDMPLAVPSIVARQLLFPAANLPGALSPIGYDGGPGLTIVHHAAIAGRIATGGGRGLQIVPVTGPDGTLRAAAAKRIAGEAGIDVVRYAGDPALLGDPAYANGLATFCWLRNVALYLEAGGWAPGEGDRHGDGTPPALLRTVPAVVFVGLADRRQLAGLPAGERLPAAEVPPSSYEKRLEYWKAALGSDYAGIRDAVVDAARGYRYEKAAIDAICHGLKTRGAPVTRDDFADALRAAQELDLGDLARPVTPRFEIKELVLPPAQEAQVLEIVRAMKSLTEIHYWWGTGKAWNESGISVLFAGPPGSGKTMAAEAMAAELGLPLFRIDLSQVVNKYIGETEKNLKRVFDATETADAILFIDEADALLGKRTEVKEAHDRYANIEISYLLERMERFRGLAILATNRKNDLDEAFLRRLRYIVDFPVPDHRERLEMWQRMIPPGADGSEIDFEFLARQFPLTGGYIRSIVFNACLQSAGAGHRRLKMEKVLRAVRAEYEKIGRPLSAEQFGPYAGAMRKVS